MTKVMTNLDSILKSRDITLPTKVRLVKAMVLPVQWMWELNCEESWVPKNWCFWTVVLEKTLESPLDCKEIKPVNLKGNKSWIFIGRTDAEAEIHTLVTWCEELTSWKRPWCWERLNAGEGDDRRWDHWMASPTWWTWVWANSRSWWRTRKPGVLQFTGLQRVGHNWSDAAAAAAMVTVTDFIFLGSKITADGDCSREIKRHLLLGRKAMTNLDRVLKSRDITLPTRSI